MNAAENRSSAPKSREHRRHALHRVYRRAHLVHAAAVGLISGLLAVAYQYSVQGAEWLSRWAAAQASSHSILGILALVVFGAGLAGLAASLIGKYAPESGGSGIPHIKSALIHLRVIRPVRLI